MNTEAKLYLLKLVLGLLTWGFLMWHLLDLSDFFRNLMPKKNNKKSGRKDK
uniref:Uncharacterized protein n=1 Tax=Serratia marcescens TaxID=615 RepID=A0A1C3HN25_SERMA|nr:Uncharacterised protein [Serratia marcescens]